jgi:pantothenate kinase
LQDGFHYTKDALSNFDDPALAFRRRGAPFTFDAHVTSPPYSATEQLLYAPNFDHALQDPVADAIPISSHNRLIIVEGNYTLLDEDPWKEVSALCEQKWFVDVPRDVVQERLVQRHLVAGIETSALKAVERVKENDLPNGDLIRKLLITPDVVLEN